MIIVSRLDGPEFALNPDLVERVEATPDTVVTLVDGTTYVVAESLPELVRRVREFRASVIAEASALERSRDGRRPSTGAHPAGRAIAEHRTSGERASRSGEGEPSPVIPLR